MCDHAILYPRRTSTGEYISNSSIRHSSDRIRAWQSYSKYNWLKVEVVIVGESKRLKVTSRIHVKKETYIGEYDISIPDYMILSDTVYEVYRRWINT